MRDGIRSTFISSKRELWSLHQNNFGGGDEYDGSSPKHVHVDGSNLLLPMCCYCVLGRNFVAAGQVFKSRGIANVFPRTAAPQVSEMDFH